MYRVKTTFGTTYNYVHSWSKWTFDNTFLVFKWGQSKDKKLILKISDIQSIEQE